MPRSSRPTRNLLEIRGRDPVHLASLAWHIGNRHLAAAIEAERILILRDHVIKSMLEGLGAVVREIVEPFNPLRGAYSSGAHGHSHGGHGHSHRHGDDHDHGHDGHHHDHRDDPDRTRTATHMKDTGIVTERRDIR